MLIRLLTCLSLFLSLSSSVFSQIIARAGEGFLEEQNGQKILHLKGTPYERGYQHGVLLKEQIQCNIAKYIDKSSIQIPSHANAFLEHIPILMSHVSDAIKEEMQGLADGSELPLKKIIQLNLFPEMFHCSGITVHGKASLNEELYHVRVLDYAVGKSLQNTAVLQVVEPESKIPYLNVSYAGFIGIVTGLNQEKIAIGEIGGSGYGSWNGMPMAFLIKEMIENVRSIEETKAYLQNFPRTCEYYYVISDGKTDESIGVYATASQIEYIYPGDSYALIAPNYPVEVVKNLESFDKIVLTKFSVDSSLYQTVLYKDKGSLSMVGRIQPEDCLLITGFPHPERYPPLVERILEHYGEIDEKVLIETIKRPVSKESNLHNAIFKPSELKVWIAHASSKDEPACDQPYTEWDFSSLLNR